MGVAVTNAVVQRSLFGFMGLPALQERSGGIPMPLCLCQRGIEVSALTEQVSEKPKDLVILYDAGAAAFPFLACHVSQEQV